MNGTGFPDGAVVKQLMFAGMPQPLPADAAAITVDSNGQFTLIFNVPSDAWWGWHPVTPI